MKLLFLVAFVFVVGSSAFSQTFPGGIKPLSSIETVKAIIPIEDYPRNYFIEGKGEVKAQSSVKLDDVYYSVSFVFNDKQLVRMNLSFEQSDYNKVIVSLAKKYKPSSWDKSEAKCYRAKGIMILVSDKNMACYYEPVLTF